MAFFKTDEELLKDEENKIFTRREFNGRVGATHTGWNFSDGLRNADKTKFKSTKFKIYDDKIMIERNRRFINYSDIKEIFQEDDKEAIIILNSDEAIPIKSLNNNKASRRVLKAFLNILKKLIEDNKSNTNIIESNTNSIEKSEDKIDKLIKLGEMHDKGLLSDEEFASLKQELLGNNEETTNINENNLESSSNTCENCGADVSPDDEFCSECGSQIN